jgi:hypothetical protein
MFLVKQKEPFWKQMAQRRWPPQLCDSHGLRLLRSYRPSQSFRLAAQDVRFQPVVQVQAELFVGICGHATCCATS